MIPFKNRFHGYGSLKYLYQKGSVIRTKNFSLKYITNPIRQQSRLAIVVSKKIDKRAVKRNLIRRRFYNIIHPLIKDFNQIYDLVFIIHSDKVLDFDYQTLTSKISDSLTKAKIID